MLELHYVAQDEFKRIEKFSDDPIAYSRLFATLCRINTLYMIANAGSGHIGSSFSSLDIVSWLFLNEMNIDANAENGIGRDIYYSSKGHDVPGYYSILCGLGHLEYDKLHLLRRVEGLPGHPDISTPWVPTNTGSLGMGISKAKGMIIANRLNGENVNVFVMLGDGELQEGQIWESLASAVTREMSELTVIIDHNKLQSDTYVSKVSDLGDLESKFTSFGWHVERCDGNDMQELADCFARCKAVQGKPKVIIADTVKGKGVSIMEHTSMKNDEPLYQFHSGAPSDDVYEKAVGELIASANAQLRSLGEDDVLIESLERKKIPAKAGLQKMIDRYADALVTAGVSNDKVVVLDADLIKDCGLLPFAKRFPDRFIECGIAEQDMVSQAGGLALRGHIPIVHSFACFLSTRPNEQIYNNATEKKRVIYVGSLAGLLPGGPGHSHQSVRDISVLSAIPGLELLEPCCEREVDLLLDYCINRSQTSSYLRLVSIPCDIPYVLPEEYTIQKGRGVVLLEGSDAVVFSYGPVVLPQVWNASKLLADKHGIRLKIINLPWLNKVDGEWLKQCIGNVETVFTVDNHYIVGGQGEMLATGIANMNILDKPTVVNLGVKEIPACGANDEVLRHHRLSGESIAEDILAVMR